MNAKPYIYLALVALFAIVIVQERCRGNMYAEFKAKGDSLRVAASLLEEQAERIKKEEGVHDSINDEVERIGKNIRRKDNEIKKLEVRVAAAQANVTPQVLLQTPREVVVLLELKEDQIESLQETIVQRDSIITTLRLDVSTLSSILFQKDSLIADQRDLNFNLQKEYDKVVKHTKGGGFFLHAAIGAGAAILVTALVK